uniref:Terminase large subunit n=1 Tax=Geladintestivirus 1 TaxID=3233133 RepID=A0AAU8MHV0_9CAUD
MIRNETTEEEYISEYPFLKYIKEDKSKYIHAKDAGYIDPDDDFLIGESGGFLLNINPGDKFVNTHLFTECADNYRKNKGKYTAFAEDSIPHRQFRKREEYRRLHGFTAPCRMKEDGTIVDVRITGSHYNFLNYTRMEQLDTSTVKSGQKGSVAAKKQDFSKFIDAQYWTHKVMEFAKNNGYHLCIDKTRRGGFSYIMAADTANKINLQPRKVAIHVAINKDYLTATGGLTDFTINNLKFYENNTPFKRGIYSTNADNYKLGFRDKNGVESPQSWGSTLFSVSAHNNPDCAIGKDAVEVKVEEVSTMDNFDEFMNVTEPAMRTGAYVTGTLICWGTATSGDMQTFSENFYSPNAHNFMPFENVWDKDSRHEVCGYFKAYAWGLQGELNGVKAMDEDGNSNLEIGLRIAFKERAAKKESAKNFAEYINYLGQYANMPGESFSSSSENIFSSEELLLWKERLRMDSAFKFYTDGMLFQQTDGKIVFKSNARIQAEGGKLNKDYWDYIEGVPRKSHEDPHGCIRRWFTPMITTYTDKTGKLVKGVPPGLYSISYDPVGVNKDKKEITNKHSHNSIKVWMNPHSINGFKPALVASYYGRPDKLEQADKICLYLAMYYNCIGTTGVEVNRGETVSNFSKWKALKYLMKDPVFLWDTKIKGMVTGNYGIIIGDGPQKLEGLRLTKEMLYTVIGKNELGEDVYFFQTIYDYQTIVELLMWNNVGNFDRVSELIIRGVEWRIVDIASTRELENKKKLKEESGYDTNILTRDWY